jgi:competence protein ComEC
MQQEQKKVDLHGLTLVAGVGGWSAGILIDSFVLLPSFVLLTGAAITFTFSILLWYKRQSRLILCLLLCLLLGAWRYSSVLLTNDPQALSAFPGMSVMIRGTVSDEPKLYGNTRVLSVTAQSMSRDSGTTWQDAHGQLTVQAPGTTIDDPYGADYGSVVELQGKLLAPLPHSSPGIQANMFFPRIRVTDTVGNPVLAALYSWRISLSTTIGQVLPQPAAALLVAILLGLRTPALRPLSSAFSATGTVHLIVSSGFKVTLLAGLVANSTKWLASNKIEQGKLLPAQKHRAWRRWLSTMLVIISIAIYTILNGAGAAAIRAGMMGELLIIAPRIGRTYNVYTSLAFAALLMSLNDPFVFWDVGFQLSFLGTLGIVLLTPFFQRLLLPIERLPLGHILTENFAVTLAAQIATLPILALNFHLLSLIAPLTNVLTVPLLGTLILLGVLICATGLLFLPLALLIGWVALPLLNYVAWIVQWCANLPYASISTNIPDGIAWCYYAFLTLLVSIVLSKWPLATLSGEHTAKQQPIPGLSKLTWTFIQLGMALLVIITTGITALDAQAANTDLTLTFLNVTSKGQPAGEAILLRTPDGKTLLIDGGMDASSLAQELDSRLPAWQRSLDAVVLTTPRQDHITGLLDIVQRYTIGEIIDGGVLHPGTTYAHWRRTISERNIRYLAANQGTNISIGRFVSLQVLWPTSPLHKGSNEVRDNGLILRIVTPGLRLLLLGAGAQSTYALSGLLDTIDTTYQQAEVVQMIEETGSPFPKELDNVLQRANPTLLLMTPAAPSKKQNAGIPSTSLQQKRVWQNIPTLRTAQVGTVQISNDQHGWSANTV